METMAAKVLAETQTITLREAVLCIDCEMLSNSTQGHCLACGSRALMNVATALGGTIYSEQPPDIEDLFAAQKCPQRRVFVVRRGGRQIGS